MVKMWAEKEMRNLARLHASGIRCPRPVQLRTHVLVMDLIGQEGVAALRLKVTHLTLPLRGRLVCDVQREVVDSPVPRGVERQMWGLLQ